MGEAILIKVRRRVVDRIIMVSASYSTLNRELTTKWSASLVMLECTALREEDELTFLTVWKVPMYLLERELAWRNFLYFPWLNSITRLSTTMSIVTLPNCGTNSYRIEY